MRIRKFKHLVLITASITVLPLLLYYVFYFLMGTVIADFYQSEVSRGINRLMVKNIYIQSVGEVWGWDGNSSLLPPIPFALDIHMEDDKRLFLSWIKSSRLKGSFYLTMIGNNVFEVQVYQDEYGKVGWGGGRDIPIKLIEEIADIELNSVDDIVKNYDDIKAFMDSFTTLDDVSWIHARPFLFEGRYWRIINVTQDPDDSTLREINNVYAKMHRRSHSVN